MKVILICGILDEPQKTPIWTHLSEAFTRHFKGPVDVERMRYHFYSRRRMLRFRDEIVVRHDTGTPCIVGGHSAGGVIALSVASLLRHTPVKGIVTIFSPLRWPYKLSSIMNQSTIPEVPIVTFGARDDVIVPHQFTKHPKSIAHKILPTSHQDGLIRDPRVADMIARYTARFIQPDSS